MNVKYNTPTGRKGIRTLDEEGPVPSFKLGAFNQALPSVLFMFTMIGIIGTVGVEPTSTKSLSLQLSARPLRIIPCALYSMPHPRIVSYIVDTLRLGEL